MSDAYVPPTNVPPVLPPPVFAAVQALAIARADQDDDAAAQQALADAVKTAVDQNQLDPGGATALLQAYAVTATPTPPPAETQQPAA